GSLSLSGNLTLTGANTYTGGTTITGTLQLGNGGTTGSIVGGIVDNGGLPINEAGTATLGTPLSGSRAPQQNGRGITVLTAAQTFTGGTTINAGTLQLGTGGSLAAGSNLAIFRGGTFVLNGHNQAIGDLGFPNQGDNGGTGNVVLDGGAAL